MPEMLHPMSRRSFLKRAGLSGLVAGVASQTMFTRLAFAAAPYAGDVLVVLSLRGGFDGLNAIVPAADPDYADPLYNLAQLEFEAGAFGRARDLWQRYLTLDPDSEWARNARRGLALCQRQAQRI